MPPALIMMDLSPVDALQDTVMMEGIAWVCTTNTKFKTLFKIDLFTVSDVILVGEGREGGKHGLNYSECMMGILLILSHYKSFRVL